MAENTERLLVLDDHRLFADGLQVILQQMPQVRSVEVAQSAQALLDNPSLLSSYDLILMDMHMPGLDGLGFMQAIHSRNITVRIAVLSGVENLESIQLAFQYGAVGYIPKVSPMSVLQDAVSQLLSGKDYVPKNLFGKLGATEGQRGESEAQRIAMGRIGSRQLEVLRLIQEGRSNKEIGTILDIKLPTVKTHVAVLFEELNVKNRTACVHKALEQGLIQP